jgi:tRNA modification GTPase
LHCHGGMLVVERVLSLVLVSGARLADPGEFTRRAFLNGRIDLVQAESVMDIISSQTDAALRLAQRQREGALSSRISLVREHLKHAVALVEAYIDFPEDDLGDTDLASISSSINSAVQEIEALLSGFDEGRVLREGISILIMGKPNAGKSSLLNRLLNENRAIVTHLPGTTRDIIEETINIGGLPVRLLDTAGIRHTDDVIEQEGIKRALEKIDQADLILFVVDTTRPFDSEDQTILDAVANSNVIVVLNKCDLPPVAILPDLINQYSQINISASSGDGVETLKDSIRTRFLHQSSVDNREFVAISRSRHRDSLATATKLLDTVRANLLHGHNLELLSVDIREALSAVCSVTGECANDEILDVIFSSFCIGK